MASPFSSFSAQDIKEKQDAPATGASPLSAASPPGDANAMRTDVFRSYSLMDVAFWDFGKNSGGTFMQRWFGTASKPTTSTPMGGPISECAAAQHQDAAPRALGAGSSSGSTCAGNSSNSWGKWVFGYK